LANKQKHSYTLGMNAMGDMTHAEFKLTKLGYNHIDRAQMRKALAPPATVSAKANPASVDWEAAGDVTGVKDQGQCGSCWSFSATGAIESARKISTGVLTSLSEQQLIDCSTAEGNQGCDGGLMDYAFEYVIKHKGLTTEAGYPYTATGPNACRIKTALATTITGYHDVTADNELALETAIAQQPVSVAIEADQSCFQFYSGGVMSNAACGTNLDHGVLAVGYGTDAGKNYYKVKNSWGASWGVKGYILLGRGGAVGAKGECGIQMAASYPTGAAKA